MTRSEKIRKLANAVKDFRGMYLVHPSGKRGKWVRAPQYEDMKRVTLWILRLKLPVEETLHHIRSMKSWQEFNVWVRTL